MQHNKLLELITDTSGPIYDLREGVGIAVDIRDISAVDFPSDNIIRLITKGKLVTKVLACAEEALFCYEFIVAAKKAYTDNTNTIFEANEYLELQVAKLSDHVAAMLDKKFNEVEVRHKAVEDTLYSHISNVEGQVSKALVEQVKAYRSKANEDLNKALSESKEVLEKLTRQVTLINEFIQEPIDAPWRNDDKEGSNNG